MVKFFKKERPEVARRPRPQARHPGAVRAGHHRHPLPAAAGPGQLAEVAHPAGPQAQHLRRLQRRPRAARAAPRAASRSPPTRAARSSPAASFRDLSVRFFDETLKHRDTGLGGWGRLHLATPKSTCTTVDSVAPTKTYAVGPVATTTAVGLPLRLRGRRRARSGSPGSPYLTGTVTALGVQNRAFYGLAVGTSPRPPSWCRTTCCRSTSPAPVTGKQRRVVLPSVAVNVPKGQNLYLVATAISDTFALMGPRVPGVVLHRRHGGASPSGGPLSSLLWGACVPSPRCCWSCVLAAATPAATGSGRRPRPTGQRPTTATRAGSRPPTGCRGEIAAPLPRWMRSPPPDRHPQQVAGRARASRRRSGTSTTPAARSAAYLLTADLRTQGPAGRLHQRRSRTPYRPAEPDAGPQQAGGGAASTATSSTSATPAPRSASARTGSAARSTAPRRLEQRVLLRRHGHPQIDVLPMMPVVKEPPEARDHQRQLALGPAGRDRRLQPEWGRTVRLPDHRRPAAATCGWC